MVERKGIPYELHTHRPGFHALALRLRGFKGRTVPALKIDGRRVQTNHDIARALDEIKPDPRLVPTDPQERTRMEEAEHYADKVLQPLARRLLFEVVIRDLDQVYDRGNSGPMGNLLAPTERGRRRVARMGAKYVRATDERIRKDREELPAVLDRIDAWVAEGVLDAENPNAATLQAGPSIALLMQSKELRPQIESRPCGQMADRLLPPPA